MESAYPIHPELFDRLMDDWGGLDRFQRTRGVLRFMASVISALWERGDTDLLILPSSAPLDHQGGLRRAAAVPRRKLEHGRAQGCGRAAVHPGGARPGVPALRPPLRRPPGRPDRVRRLRAGGEGAQTAASTTASFGSAAPSRASRSRPSGTPLRHLSDRATYLYQDGSRHWFATLPSVARLAEDRAAALEPDEVDEAITKRLREERRRGEFERVHIAPASPADVPDETDAGLVILGPKFPHAGKADGDRATPAAREFLENGRSGPRIYRNSLLFLAATRGG